jgi:pantoate--beta-alanine ligase
MHQLRQGQVGQFGLVPTMGALHEGHLALIRRCRSENDVAAMSLFVNPKQFDAAADLAAYPRDVEGDLELARQAGIDLVWAPTQHEVYPPGFATTVAVGDLGSGWEGAARPGHFDGVATVVAKLLTLMHPDRAYFGQKDAQQLAVVRQLRRDLDMATTIVACPTVREPDGLALSSRNRLLTQPARQRARALSAALEVGVRHFRRGVRSAAEIVGEAQTVLASQVDAIDYLAVVDAASFAELGTAAEGALLLVAARVDGVRLIDNQAFEEAV